MSRFSISITLALGLASLATPALADLGLAADEPAMVMNARIAQDMRSRAARLGISAHTDADTVWVGYNPAYAGSNYWSIGVGHRLPRGTTGPNKADIIPVPDDDTGYWDSTTRCTATRCRAGGRYATATPASSSRTSRTTSAHGTRSTSGISSAT